MLRYKTENRPGLVALYDIRPGNGAGQFFLQPRIPHGANAFCCILNSFCDLTSRKAGYIILHYGTSNAFSNQNVLCGTLKSMEPLFGRPV